MLHYTIQHCYKTLAVTWLLHSASSSRPAGMEPESNPLCTDSTHEVHADSTHEVHADLTHEVHADLTHDVHADLTHEDHTDPTHEAHAEFLRL